MATPVDPNKQASLNIGTIAQLKELIAKARDFVSRVYIPDVLAVASFYKDWAAIGEGVGNYMVYGEYPEDDGDKPQLFFPSGVIWNKDLSKVEDLDPAKITESITHSWYEYAAATARRCTRRSARRSRNTPARSRRTIASTRTRSTAG